MNKKGFWTLLISIVIINIYSIHRFKNMQQILLDQNNFLLQENMTIKDKLTSREALLNLNYTSVHIKKRFKEIANLNIDLKAELESGEKTILFYKEGACGSCIFKLIQDLRILARKISTDNIIVITTWQNGGKPVIIENNNFKHYLVDKDILGNENFIHPFIFQSDKQLNIKSIYVPNLFPDFQQKFFTKIF